MGQVSDKSTRISDFIATFMGVQRDTILIDSAIPHKRYSATKRIEYRKRGIKKAAGKTDRFFTIGSSDDYTTP
jgi:hypothetical protein